MFCRSGIHVCIVFQTHCVLKWSAFLFMSNYVMHNKICFDLYKDSDKLGKGNVRLQDNFVYLKCILGH